MRILRFVCLTLSRVRCPSDTLSVGSFLRLKLSYLLRNLFKAELFSSTSGDPLRETPDVSKLGFGLKGFTLIEVIVATSITLILLWQGLVKYNEFNRKQQVKQSGLDFVSALRLVQNRALTGDKPAGCTGSLFGYRVEYGGSETTYNIIAECEESGDVVVDRGVNLGRFSRFSAAFPAIKFESIYGTAAYDVVLCVDHTTDSGLDDLEVSISKGGAIDTRNISTCAVSLSPTATPIPPTATPIPTATATPAPTATPIPTATPTPADISAGLLLQCPFDNSFICKDGENYSRKHSTPAFSSIAKAGKSLYMNGDDRLSYSGAGNIDRNQGTVTLWVRLTKTQQCDNNHFGPYFLYKPDTDSSPGRQPYLVIADGYLKFEANNSPNWYGSYWDCPESWKDQWHHIAAAWDPDGSPSTRMWVDGVQVAQGGGNWAALSINNIDVGSMYDWSSSAADAYIDDFRIYNRVLDTSEVQTIMNAGGEYKGT